MTSADDLLSYMARAGWQPISQGPVGTMWSYEPSLARVGVPAGVDSASPEWDNVVVRVAAAMSEEPSRVRFKIAHEHMDEFLIQAANDYVIVDSIPLSAGQALVESASKMLRAAAATAQQPRPVIGSYSADGDAVFDRARMGHTRHGSYVVPVLMPIPRAALGAENTDAEPALEGLELVREPVERRTMRTFAQALTAVSKLVVEPAIDPPASIAAGLVVAGVSRQFLMALREVVGHESVASFGSSFNWAGSVPSPRNEIEAVTIPSEAAPLLGAAAAHLSRRVVEPSQTMTGPIVEWHREPGAEYGWAGVQTLRGGHDRIIRVDLSEVDLLRALEYARQSQTVAVRGIPAGGRGKQVRIARPESFLSLDEMMFRP